MPELHTYGTTALFYSFYVIWSDHIIPSPPPMQAADRALAEASGGRAKVRPVEPRKAARGQLDYLQVGGHGHHSPTADLLQLLYIVCVYTVCVQGMLAALSQSCLADL